MREWICRSRPRWWSFGAGVHFLAAVRADSVPGFLIPAACCACLLVLGEIDDERVSQ